MLILHNSLQILGNQRMRIMQDVMSRLIQNTVPQKPSSSPTGFGHSGSGRKEMCLSLAHSCGRCSPLSTPDIIPHTKATKEVRLGRHWNLGSDFQLMIHDPHLRPSLKEIVQQLPFQGELFLSTVHNIQLGVTDHVHQDHLKSLLQQMVCLLNTICCH